MTVTRNVSVPEELYESFDSAATALDVNTGTYITALLIGAARSGNADRHALVGLDFVEHKRRMRPRRAWVAEGESGVSDGQPVPEASAWRFGDWTLVRLGHPNHTRSPEEGWFLEGPGVDDATHVGWTRQQAYDNAEPIIARWERQQAAKEDHDQTSQPHHP